MRAYGHVITKISRMGNQILLPMVIRFARECSAFGHPLTKEPDDSCNSDRGYRDVGEVSSYKQLHWFPLFDRVHRTLSGLSARPH